MHFGIFKIWWKDKDRMGPFAELFILSSKTKFKRPATNKSYFFNLTFGSEGVVGTDATSRFAGGLVFFTVDLEGGLVAELLLEVDFGVLGSGLLQSRYKQTQLKINPSRVCFNK